MDESRRSNEVLSILVTAAATVAEVENAAQVRETACGGGSMRWRIWGSGAPLVLLHGDFGSWTHWLLNILPLAARFRVIVPDMPGYGDSDLPPEPFSPEGLAKVLAEGLAEIIPPRQRYSIAGFSFGGIVAAHLSSREGERVENLVLLGAGGFGVKRGDRPAMRRFAADMDAAETIEVHRHNLSALMIAGPAKVDDLAVYLQIENTRRARVRAGDIPASDSLLRALPDVKARIHGIWGRRDSMIGQQLEDLAASLRRFQPDLKFRVIDGAGHWTPYEAFDAVNATLLDMLARTSSLP